MRKPDWKHQCSAQSITAQRQTGDKVRKFRAALPPGNTGRTFCQDFRVAAAILLAPANE